MIKNRLEVLEKRRGKKPNRIRVASQCLDDSKVYQFEGNMISLEEVRTRLNENDILLRVVYENKLDQMEAIK